MKDKNLLFSFLTLVFGGTLFLNTVALSPLQNRNQAGTDPTDMKQMAGNQFSMIKNNQATGTVDPKDILKGEKAIKKLKSGGALGLNWTSRGPDNIAGRTKSIIVDNRDATGKTLYAGSVAGGIWKSVTGGLTWNQVDASGINLNVTCMVQAANGDIYAGTGDNYYNFLGTPQFYGRGIFKSTDGNSFRLLESTNPSLLGEWSFINELAIDNTNGRLYVANNNGIKYSDDGGVTWNLISESTGGYFGGDRSDVKVASDGTVVVSIIGNCWISRNGDPNNFQSITNDTIAGLLPSTGIGKIKFAFAPSDPNVLYALAANNGNIPGLIHGKLENVYKSTDKGSTWTIIGPGGSSDFDPFYYNEGNYAGTISVFPNDPNRILIAGSLLWEGKKVLETGFYQWEQRFNPGWDIHSIVFAPSNPDVIFLAGDFGLITGTSDFQTLKFINKTYNTSQFYSVAFSPNNEELLGGTQGYGVVYIDGKGNSPETAYSLINGGKTGCTEISQIDPKVFIYAGDGSDLYRSNDKGVTTSGTFLEADSMDNSSSSMSPFLLWESFNNVYSRDSITFIADTNTNYHDTTIFVHSKNGRYPFPYAISGDLAGGDSIRIQDIVSSKFFLGVPGRIFMTKHVHDFTKIPDWDKIAYISGIPMSMAYSKDANFLFVGTTQGNLYRISNIALASDSLRADVASSSCIISTSLIQTYEEKSITSISIDPTNVEHILITLGNYVGNSSINDYVYESINALDEFPTFGSVQGNLPKISVYSSLIEMNSPDRVMIGTDYGIFTTENLGSSAEWTQENEGMGEVPVMMLRQQTLDRPWSPGVVLTKNFGVIYAATYGRGLFESRKYVGINDHQEVAVNNQLRIYPNPASDLVKIAFASPSVCTAKLNIFDLSGHLVKNMNLGKVKSGEVEHSFSTSDMETGSYLIQVVAGSTRRSAKLVVVH